MFEYVTPNGNSLWYKVYYDAGGLNYFTYTTRKRGYYVTIQRKRNQFAAFSDLSSPDGAIKYLVKEVKRQSQKQKLNAEAEAKQLVADIVAVYNQRGVNL